MYCAIIIGGGASGLTAAIGLASAGKKILLIEKDHLGGECTWGGCVPSKSFIAASKICSTLNDALSMAQKNVQTIGDSEIPHISKYDNIDYIKGEAFFIKNNTVSVNGKTYSSKYIIIATGSSAFVPPIKGLENIDYLTNHNFFYEQENYKSIILIGAGIISLELAFPLKKLGVDVTILERSDIFLPMMEKEIREFYFNKLNISGINLYLDCKSMEIEKQDNDILIKTNNGNFLTEKIFISAGRVPNINNLNLEKANIKYDNKGVIVDEFMRTTQKNVFAIGDIASNFKFSHVAGYQGEIVIRNILFPFIKKRINYSNIPWTIFGDIEVSKVGLNEGEAKAKYKKIYIYSLDKNNDRSLISFEKNFTLKVICDNKFNIIGAICIGERAGEIIGFLQLMIGNKIKFYKVMKSIQAYPTYTYYIRNLSKLAYVDFLKNLLPKINN
ncbi:dihydrolipoyl dehydrogenase family protein [Candidatus Cetobacterium colombiensis]|uniref:NAD(P)/FAD-dependent oxidoreductase n=1 Tax=Candidatus Cetobacterium colombiensis TaxID=3073100 RepID=A0ABU4WCE8_9FUSO|nr:NAD(P)/FAD-dependent oxidoreductase [Candidatus Cetobacterium colombiensis]MDX8336173.1 NAD(P)/FAD-dependent oxidoreductase [Candidatus Cetobacterium colombiensis]